MSTINTTTINTTTANNTTTNNTTTAQPYVYQHIGLYEDVSMYLIVLNTIFNTFGIVTNVINMAVFSQMYSRETINISLLGMSLSDFLSCITGAGAALCEYPQVQGLLVRNLNWHPRDFLSTFFGQPHITFARASLTITAFITLERCVCVAIPLRVKLIFSRPVVQVINLICFALSIASYIPLYTAYYFPKCSYPSINLTINCLVIDDEYYSRMSKWLSPITVWLFYGLQYVLIIICTMILIVVLNKRTKWHKSSNATRTTNGNSSAKDTRVIRMLVMIASLYVICNMPIATIWIWHEVDKETSIHGDSRHLVVTLFYVAFALEAFSASMNLFIYYTYSTLYKDVFHKTFCTKTMTMAKHSEKKI